MIKTTTDETRFQHNPRRELYDSRDNIDIYREVFAGIKEALSSNWIRYDFKRTYYYDFKKKVIISNKDRLNGDVILDSFRLFTFNINNYSKNKVVSKYKQMVKERNYENLDFSWDELYTEVHSIFKKKIEKLHTIVIPDVSDTNNHLSFRLIVGEFCYTEVDSNVLITALLNMTYSGYTFFTYSSDRIEQFESLISKYNITIQDVNYFFEKNAKFQYSLGSLQFFCKFVSRDTVLEVIKTLLSKGISKSKLIRQMSGYRDRYTNDEGLQFFIDYIWNLPDN